MKSRYKIILAVIVIIVVAAVVYWFGFARNSGNKIIDPKKIEALAKCLTQKGVAMYGAYWCPHCQAQKKLFGDSFRYVNYVECTKDIKKCQEKKIEGYPTWIFKNGDRIKGEATFEELAKKTSCKAP